VAALSTFGYPLVFDVTTCLVKPPNSFYQASEVIGKCGFRRHAMLFPVSGLNSNAISGLNSNAVPRLRVGKNAQSSLRLRLDLPRRAVGLFAALPNGTK
jgi:hypothetical protein